MRLQPTAAVSYWEKNTVGGAQTVYVAQVYVRFDVFPGGDVRLVHAEGTGHDLAVKYDSATGQLGCAYDDAFTGGFGGPALSLSTWYKIDFKADMSTGTLTADARVDGTALPQAGGTDVSGTYSAYKLGPNSEASTMTLYFDELSVSNTAADYPLFAGSRGLLLTGVGS